MTWRHLAASVTGRSHLARKEPGQDYCRAGIIQISNHEFFIGLAADGAGSTVHGGIGAEIACETLYSAIIESLGKSPGISPVTKDEACDWISQARGVIGERAGKDRQPMRDYACTLLGVIARDNGAVFFQIGDGGIVINQEDSYRTVFWPDQGEYANTTFFITDEKYLDHIRFEQSSEIPKEIAVFTDGLQNLVLSFSQKSVHAGFFKPLFTALTQKPDNPFTGLTQHLKNLLSRTDISERSDDDKTLILAVRLPAE
ncbi:MAG: PP2C family serine/threonine-protein phosphatase [Methanoregula sp.]|jgi:hypothetical protein